jgi:hypothetical protein
MKKLEGIKGYDWGWLRSREVLWLLIALAALASLLVYKLGSLVGALSIGEVQAATQPVGWHGIFHAPLDLPLKLVRSVVYFFAADHGQTLTRWPNTLFGALAVISFSWLVWLWHGRRTAIFMTLMFATSAWVLHASRLASYDVLYLCAVPLLLLAQALMYRNSQNPAVWYGSFIIWGMLLYVPGMIWLVGLHLFLQRKILSEAWQDEASSKRRLTTAGLSAVWLPLLVIDFFRPGHFMQWLGMPAHFAAPLTLLKHFVGVFVHLFIRGPQYPDIWLGRAPVLDVFTLLVTVIGIYFYTKHWKAWRSRTLGLMFMVGAILVALGGPVGLSLLVPLLYLAAAAGLAYILHEWLKVFPLNPLARSLGIGIIALLVGLSCLYNLRAYFVAWPHNQDTRTTFQYHQ